MITNLKNPTSKEFENLSNLHKENKFIELEKSCRLLLKRYPKSYVIYSLLGGSLINQKRYEESIHLFNEAIRIKPDIAINFYNRGVAEYKANQFRNAIQSYQRAVDLDPRHVNSLYNLGIVLRDVGKLDEAIKTFDDVINLDEDHAEAYGNKGFCFKKKNQLEQALINYSKAVELNPKHAGVLNNRGNVHKELWELNKAILDLNTAIKLQPTYAAAYNTRGTVFQSLGQMENAIRDFEKAIQLKPDFTGALSNLLLTLNYLPYSDSAKQYTLATQFGKIVNYKTERDFPKHKNLSTPKVLHIGFVSGDLNQHPVGYFLESVLSSLNNEKVRLFAYPTNNKFDNLSARICQMFHSWNSISGKTDLEAAKLISEDEIHILIDLSGHTADNRLSLFAYKPSPVQVSWLGYFATTGLDEIDYIIADPIVAPQELASQFTETVWHLPETRWCFTPPNSDAKVSRLPALINGYITFGCFNSIMKITPIVVRTWAKILCAVPGSKLLLKSKQFQDRIVREHMLQNFYCFNIDLDRIIVEEPEDRKNYLLAYNKIDIALDPFPFTGGATSVEALWMGVPFITVCGNSLVSRQGAAILTHTKLQQWIAKDEIDYIQKAIRFSSNLEKLTDIRKDLRINLLRSPLVDSNRFAKYFEEALWGMWEESRNVK